MNNFWTSNTYISRAADLGDEGSKGFLVFRKIEFDSVGGCTSRFRSPLDQPFIPLCSVFVETRHDLSTVCGLFMIEGDGTGKLVCTMSSLNPFGNINVSVGKSSLLPGDHFLGNIRVGNEAPFMAWSAGSVEGIPGRILADQLLCQAEEHVPQKAHLWFGGMWLKMVLVHLKFLLDLRI